MVEFKTNELEIAMVTCNRTEFVKEWLNKCYLDCYKRNICISIYDSSTNENTKILISKLNKEKEIKIRYIKVDPKINIGYKPVEALLNANSKYTWIVGDSRYPSFEELDNTVFKSIKNNVDFILMQSVNNKENNGKLYLDKNEFLKECFISLTCIGFSIYKNSIFNILKENKDELKECDKRFKGNYAFAWLGYFLYSYSKHDFKAQFYRVKKNYIFPNLKKQTWVTRFYGCWVDDLCDLIDNIPNNYENKEKILEQTWKDMHLLNFQYSYTARKYGDLNLKNFKKYLTTGKINRVTKKTGLVFLYAITPIIIFDIIKYLIETKIKYKQYIKNYLKLER